jgi:hypothetical protein
VFGQFLTAQMLPGGPGAAIGTDDADDADAAGAGAGASAGAAGGGDGSGAGPAGAGAAGRSAGELQQRACSACSAMRLIEPISSAELWQDPHLADEDK